MADDERPRGTCVIDGCPRDPYRREDGSAPIVCGPCTSRLRGWLSEIPDLCSELQAKSAPEEVTVRAEVRERLVGWHVPEGWHPPLELGRVVQVEQLVVAGALPAAGVAGAARGGPVSGSPARRLPIDEDAVDLLAARRSLRRSPGPDDIGFLPIASTLDFWVQDLRDHRNRGEGLPEPSVTVLCRWLLDRIDDACDDWLPIDECFDDVRRAHGALRGQLGQIEQPQHLRGVPCPKCQILSALVHLDTAPNEPERISCSACGILLSISEYEEYTTMLSAMLTAEGREAAKRAAADRRAVVRLLREMHAVGWRHTAGWVGHTDPDTGALDAEARLHFWRRGDEEIEVAVWLEPASGTDLRYGTAPATNDGWIGSAWLVVLGAKRLHALASAAGVLSVPRERAA